MIVKFELNEELRCQMFAEAIAMRKMATGIPKAHALALAVNSVDNLDASRPEPLDKVDCLGSAAQA